MCDCTIQYTAVRDDELHSPVRRYLDTAEDIRAGRGDRIAAGNLLFAIRHGEIRVESLPVALYEIEATAGRRIDESVT